jgi:hypothetical protein
MKQYLIVGILMIVAVSIIGGIWIQKSNPRCGNPIKEEFTPSIGGYDTDFIDLSDRDRTISLAYRNRSHMTTNHVQRKSSPSLDGTPNGLESGVRVNFYHSQ